MSRDEVEDLWEPSPETAHPKAAQILTNEFFWDCVDENSPFGNDTGADTLAFLRVWREAHPHSDPVEFLGKVLAEVFEVPDAHWDVVEPERVRELLVESEYEVSARDDAVIAVAFGQLVLEGNVETEIRRRALSALLRQESPAVMEHRGWVSPAERIERLRRMREALIRL